jgi:hypothetical protein
MMESRPYGGGHANFVGIRCGWCRAEEWHPAKNGGWAMRIFRAHGWKVANKDAQHRCPACFGKAKHARRIPDNPAIPADIGRRLKTTIMEAHVRDALLGTTSINRLPEAPPPVAVELSDKAKARLQEKPVEAPLPPEPPLVPAEPEPSPTPAPEPAPAYAAAIHGGRGRRSKPGFTIHPQRYNARQAAARATGGIDGINFLTLATPPGVKPKGWIWKLAADVTPQERVAWVRSRKVGPKTMPRRADSPLHTPTMEEPQMTNNVTPITRKEPMPSAPTSEEIAKMASSIVSHVAAVPPSQPTRDQRTLIHDELTKVYDTVDQRYGGHDSDKNLAGRLDVPRVWVTDIRVGFFGDYDRNQQSEKQKLKLDAAIDMAKAATQHLLNMAAEAEAIEKSLVEARKLLEG